MEIKDFNCWPLTLEPPQQLFKMKPLTLRIRFLQRRFHLGPESA